MVSVNDAQVNYLALELPMGGWKASGLGSRHGADGIRKYTKQQAILVTRFALKKDLHMLPYKARTTKLIERLRQAGVRPRQARLAPQAGPRPVDHRVRGPCSPAAAVARPRSPGRSLLLALPARR